MRFDYDCVIVAVDFARKLFLDECSAYFYPAVCNSLRCGSIIVSLSSPSEDLMKEHKQTVNMKLPSFGTAQRLELPEDSALSQENTDSASLSGRTFFFIGIGVILFAIIALYLRRQKRRDFLLVNVSSENEFYTGI